MPTEKYIKGYKNPYNMEIIDIFFSTSQSKNKHVILKCHCGKEGHTVAMTGFNKTKHCGCEGNKYHALKSDKQKTKKPGATNRYGLKILQEYEKVNGFRIFQVKCHCGNIFDTRATGFIYAKSCGCRTNYVPNRPINDNKRFTVGRFNYFVNNSFQRQIHCDLTYEQWVKLSKSFCVYCGESNLLLIGIDRRDPKLGYTLNNCDPCCKICNYSKHRLSKIEFLNHIEKMYKHITSCKD